MQGSGKEATTSKRKNKIQAPLSVSEEDAVMEVKVIPQKSAVPTLDEDSDEAEIAKHTPGPCNKKYLLDDAAKAMKQLQDPNKSTSSPPSNPQPTTRNLFRWISSRWNNFCLMSSCLRYYELTPNASAHPGRACHRRLQ